MPQVSLAAPWPCPAVLPAPSLPPTVRDVDVPPLLRRRFILTGYRPAGLPWRRCVLSLFQVHNQTLNVWSPLLAAVGVLLRFSVFAVLRGGGILGFRLQGPEGQGFSVDVSSLPLVLYAFSAVTYLSFSAAAHLLQSQSEDLHSSLVLLDHVGVAIYQYGCAVALSTYSADAAWTQSMLGQVFLPAAAVLTWFSFAAGCYAKLHFGKPRPLVPVGVAYLLDISPVAHRLITRRWGGGPAALLHVLQVALFPLSVLFLSSSVPERFCPGRFDIIGNAHQLSQVLRALGTLVQQEALFQDFLWRRPALVREFGEERLLLACVSFPFMTLCCSTTALAMRRRGQAGRLSGNDGGQSGTKGTNWLADLETGNVAGWS